MEKKFNINSNHLKSILVPDSDIQNKIDYNYQLLMDLDEYIKNGIPFESNYEYDSPPPPPSNYDEIDTIEEPINEQENNFKIELKDKSTVQKSYQLTKNNKFVFNQDQYIKKVFQEIDDEFNMEIEHCTKSLPNDFKPARGRGRIKQLSGLSLHQKKMEEKSRLIKNKFAARKARLKRNEITLRRDAEISFLKNKINKYEILIEKILSKIK